MATFYLVGTAGTVRTSWNVSLGVLTHIFEEIKQHSRLNYLENSARKQSNTEIIVLRKIHLRTCELLQDFCGLYSYQILCAVTCFCLLIAFRAYGIVMYLVSVGLPNDLVLNEMDYPFAAYTLCAIIVNAHMCVSQVRITMLHKLYRPLREELFYDKKKYIFVFFCMLCRYCFFIYYRSILFYKEILSFENWT